MGGVCVCVRLCVRDGVWANVGWPCKLTSVQRCKCVGEGKRGGQMVKSSYHIVWGRGTGRDAWSSEMYIYME